MDVDKIIAGMSEGAQSLLRRFAASAMEDFEMVQLRSDEEFAAAKELKRAGLVAIVLAVFLFAAITETGLAVRARLLGEG